MTFTDFWKLGSYINRVRVESITGREYYDGIGRRLRPLEYVDCTVESFTVERGVLIITIKGEETENEQ